MTITEKSLMAETYSAQMTAQLAKIGATEKELAIIDEAIKNLYAQREKLARRAKRQERELRKIRRESLPYFDIEDVDILIDNASA